MTPASSGLCSETWAWVEGNFVCHLFSSSVLKNLARFKNNAENWNKIKHMGSALVACFLSLWDPMFWLCFCMLCVCLCVCLCACCETLRTCTVVCMSFLCYVFFWVWRCFQGWANAVIVAGGGQRAWSKLPRRVLRLRGRANGRLERRNIVAGCGQTAGSCAAFLPWPFADVSLQAFYEVTWGCGQWWETKRRVRCYYVEKRTSHDTTILLC